MEKDFPLKFEIFSSEENDKYRLTSKKEIVSILHHIAEKGSRIALYYGGTNDFILTTLLGVDSAGMWLEKSRNNINNQYIANSSKLVFVSSHVQAKIQFTVNHADNVEYQDIPAFYLPLPDNIYRLQRREYYRLMAPANNPLRCTIATGETLGKQPHEFTIMDISCGGVGLTCKETDTELIAGKTYHDCCIDLPEVGRINGTVEVKTLIILSSVSGHIQKRAGCEFKNLDRASNILLQRYVMMMQLSKQTPKPAYS